MVTWSILPTGFFIRFPQTKSGEKLFPWRRLKGFELIGYMFLRPMLLASQNTSLNVDCYFTLLYDYHIITNYSKFCVFACLENFLCDELESIGFIGLVNLR